MSHLKEANGMKQFNDEQRTTQETEPKKNYNIENVFATSIEENTHHTQELNTATPETKINVDEYKAPETTSTQPEVETVSSQQPDLNIADAQSKVGQIFQNSVAATTSVAVVVVATPLFDNVNAQFIELRLLENQIYYEVEILESVGEEQEPNGRPLRLIVESQWETIEVELEYGLNQNVLTGLRPNAQYTFTVQMDKGLVWNTLVSERVQTESELAGVIGPASTLASFEGRDVTMNIFAQAGGVEIQFYQFVVIEDGQAIITLPVVEGEQTINFNLPPANKSFEIQLQAITANSELVTLDSRAFNPKAIFNSTLDASYIYPHQILIQPTIVPDAFIDAQYRLILKQDNLVFENIPITDDLLLEVSPDTNYTLEWVAVYTDPRTGEGHQDVLSSLTLTTPPELFYILQEIRRDDAIQVLMQFENYDSLLESTYVDIIDSQGNVHSLEGMQFITSQFNTGLYEWQFAGPLLPGSRIEVGVILSVTPGLKIPLYQINP